ncbi:hypothetical protein A2W13_03065 [Candidatus Woesebacteria bacterium RBG_16_36_11]|uniref:Uncharacterized protein n=1 Tax=Candidatus Woesebacteria bacterium RBG_16_36_11 TaxID=1802481 RepID=A0A1F7X938_9BACT|nr:MAG: hypothetical protein A2W13_03065 [Candidatus Woesebacteria bacterium RBG_16_36_11]
MGIENWIEAPASTEDRHNYLKTRTIDLIINKKLHKSAVVSGLGLGVTLASVTILDNPNIAIVSGMLTGANIGKDALIISIREAFKKGGYLRILR